MARDILIDDDGDLEFSNGDFKIGTSDEQHVILLINTMPGAWKQFPKVGVGIIQYSASAGQSAPLKSSINTQMENDGFKNIEVNLTANPDGHYDYYINADRLD